jgi:hypothetical protein
LKLKSPLRLRSVTTLAILALAPIAVTLTAHSADAAYATCRTDPTVRLSDGRTIVLYADISDTLSDVRRVNYTLHVPVGTYATSIRYDSTGYLENVTILPDQQYSGYSDTQVITGTLGVAVTAYGSVTTSNSPQPTVAGTVSGRSGQHLILRYAY